MEQGCKATAHWLQKGFREFAAQIALDAGSADRDVDAVYADVSQRFLGAVLSGHRDLAVALIGELQGSDDWLKLIRDTCERLENEWQAGALTLSDVTEGFWTTQGVFRRLRDRLHELGSTGLQGRSCVFWVQPDDLHTLGAQCLSEAFERAGWTASLMVNAEADTVLALLAETEVDVLGVSVGCDEHLLGLADFLTEARIRSLKPDLTVMVGGAAIEGKLSQYRFLGADILAKDAETALGQVRRKCDA